MDFDRELVKESLSKVASSKISEWGKSLPSNLGNGQDLWSLPEEMGRAEN